MESYEITFSYYHNGKRIKETDMFYGDTAQEAVDACRAEYPQEFADQFGRIEYVVNEWTEIITNWE